MYSMLLPCESATVSGHSLKNILRCTVFILNGASYMACWKLCLRSYSTVLKILRNWEPQELVLVSHFLTREEQTQQTSRIWSDRNYESYYKLVDALYWSRHDSPWTSSSFYFSFLSSVSINFEPGDDIFTVSARLKNDYSCSLVIHRDTQRVSSAIKYCIRVLIKVYKSVLERTIIVVRCLGVRQVQTVAKPLDNGTSSSTAHR